ncbi:Anti-anti-sigma regulatory factor (antagonist of anti-sigma factor) [Mycobacterium rhizamassiliense]|jgi:anti-anti-sigma factor|uniref:Anti-anti-sigma regulatory factor (Antagonist of anti-sigma factor) n=1 Tax=Mycobacterium rhizamassiliense TaxID=1841860 RepID=A0A2U3NQ88_9MYCO|nr:STAS domain-containing protein [Mycobacterium rhizamassiliense]SPM33671.1 Anti-anti-sigma regulatory factor (antagonist of anti-sigma factor) [Mycobacterium rhizamassiliense]
MAPALTLNTDRGADGTPRVVVAGEIDLSNTAELTRALIDARAGSRAPMTVDLSAVKYIDSAGINVLFDHAEEIDRLHVIVHPLLFRVLTISGLSKIAIVESADPPLDGHGPGS